MASANMEEMADLLGVSVPTLRATIKRYADFPIVHRGSNGVPWQFDPDAVTAFLTNRRREEETAAAERFRELDQFRLPIAEMGDDKAGALTPQQELAVARKRLLDQQFAKEAGFLVQTAEVRQVITAALAKFQRAAMGLPEQLGRRFGWREAETRECTAAMEAFLETLKEDLMQIGPTTGAAAGPGDPADAGA